ncbi:MAG TPA: PAS domain S-box protein [Candidatus Angelobacter sp.]
MSPQLEQIVIFSVMSVLVMLFTWIYIQHRQQRVGLWMLGWIAIFIHFTAELLASFSLLSPNWKNFIKVGTLEVAGISFLLSVSQAYTTTRRRILYFLMVGLPAVVYLAFLLWAPQHRWIFPTLLLGSVGTVVVNSLGHYRLRTFYFYIFLAMPTACAIWAAGRSVSNPRIGLIFYLSNFFILAGLLYMRHYRRFSPGVIFTSVAFVMWGLVFPVANVLRIYNLGPAPTSAVWDLPKYFVALGMILTLFENQTEVATQAARQYRSLFDVNLAAVSLSTVEGQFLDCNNAFVSMYGCSSKEEVLATPAVSLYVQPEDRELFIRHLLREGRAINYEIPQRRKDGSVFWVLKGASMLTDEAGREVIEVTALDITERKQAEIALRQSEERFATIFRHSPVGCGIATVEGVFVNANAALLKMLGRPAEEVIGKTGVELGLWKSQEERNEFYRRLCAEGSIKNMEIEFTDAAGNKHNCLYFGTLVRINDKECIFGMQLDCTEQRELEAKFLQAQKMEAVGRLAGGVAHDFNNLLGVIGGYAELLEARLAREEKLRNYCRKILETTQRAGSLTNQLLTFSRKEITRPSPLNPNQAIRDLAAILPRLIGEDIEITLDLCATGVIVMDKIHFEQIIFNIVVNARDAMPSGGQLTISTKDRACTPVIPSNNGNAGRQVLIRIQDTGIGMDEATRVRAFEPFFTTKETGRGTGLGLSTVYGIVQQCGGEISIESRVAEGTAINIVLPATAPANVPAERHASLDLIQGSGQILLVEDETELRNANAEFLTSIGYSVACAGSGPEALQLLQHTNHVDLVISDVVMPKMSGREFADRLLKLRPNTKILFISGYADDVVLKTGISRAGTPFLQKPYSLRQLGAKIRELLKDQVSETVENPTLGD